MGSRARYDHAHGPGAELPLDHVLAELLGHLFAVGFRRRSDVTRCPWALPAEDFVWAERSAAAFCERVARGGLVGLGLTRIVDGHRTG